MKSKHYYKSTLIILQVFFSISVFSQGKLLLIGGGSESDDEGAWNLEPYSWAVDQSLNKKVAILSFNTESDWIRNYFMEQCGAEVAKDFKINSGAIANAQSTYDSLTAYDVIFMKGGDQWNYYSTWKNTLTHQAIVDVFNRGGVICGTSAGLAVQSEVIFTAQRGTVYPDECLEDPANQYVTLANDFLSLFNGYIFDSHFTDRGRGARLTGFLANRYLYHDQILGGIGVDETTAMCIDENGTGTVYGTGAVNIYTPLSDNPFRLNDGMLITDSIRIDQLLHHDTYDFNNNIITGLEETFSPEVPEENGNYTVLMSGSDNLSDNQEMLEDFVGQGNGSDDLILIITGSSQSIANTYKSRLTNLGATGVVVYSAIGSMQEDPDFERAINDASKFLFVNNEFYILEHFLESGANGALLEDKIRHDDMVNAFVGDNSRFAGAVVIENYLFNNAAANGSLVFKEGLNLLKTSVIMPNTYYDSDMYMNAAAGVPYVMLQNNLRFGFWLTSSNYMCYSPEAGNTYMSCYGSLPGMSLELKGNTKGDFAEKTWSNNYNKPAMVAGFEGLNLRIFSNPDKIQTGGNLSAYGISSHNAIEIEVGPNPVSEMLNISTDAPVALTIYDVSGKLIYTKENTQNDRIDVSNFSNGVYLLKVTEGEKYSTRKIIISSNEW